MPEIMSLERTMENLLKWQKYRHNSIAHPFKELISEGERIVLKIAIQYATFSSILVDAALWEPKGKTTATALGFEGQLLAGTAS